MEEKAHFPSQFDCPKSLLFSTFSLESGETCVSATKVFKLSVIFLAVLCDFPIEQFHFLKWLTNTFREACVCTIFAIFLFFSVEFCTFEWGKLVNLCLLTTNTFWELFSYFSDEPNVAPNFEPTELMCPPFRAQGILWNWTLPGQAATAKCPPGSVGTAKFTCTQDGYWELSPDMLDCKSLQVQNCITSTFKFKWCLFLEKSYIWIFWAICLFTFKSISWFENQNFGETVMPFPRKIYPNGIFWISTI